MNSVLKILKLFTSLSDNVKPDLSEKKISYTIKFGHLDSFFRPRLAKKVAEVSRSAEKTPLDKLRASMDKKFFYDEKFLSGYQNTGEKSNNEQ